MSFIPGGIRATFEAGLGEERNPIRELSWIIEDDWHIGELRYRVVLTVWTRFSELKPRRNRHVHEETALDSRSCEARVC